MLPDIQPWLSISFDYHCYSDSSGQWLAISESQGWQPLALDRSWQILTDLDRSWQILTGRHDWFLDGVLHPRARGVGGGRWSLGRWESHPPWGSESRFRCARCLFALGCCQWRRHDLLDTLKNTMDHEQKDREKTEVSLFFVNLPCGKTNITMENHYFYWENSL